MLDAVSTKYWHNAVSVSSGATILRAWRPVCPRRVDVLLKVVQHLEVLRITAGPVRRALLLRNRQGRSAFVTYALTGLFLILAAGRCAGQTATVSLLSAFTGALRPFGPLTEVVARAGNITIFAGRRPLHRVFGAQVR